MLSRREFVRLSAASAALTYAPIPLPAELTDVDFSFIQLTDTHLSVNRLYSERRSYDVPAEEALRRSRLTVREINGCSLPYEWVVHTGDVTETRETDADIDLAAEVLQFDKPAAFVPGNHDVGYSRTAEYLPRFEQRFGPVNRAIEPAEGLRVALFNSQPLDPRASEEHSEKAFAELDKILSPAKPTILCCHCMGLESFHLNRIHPGWPDPIMRRWTDRLKTGGVVAVIAGHFHRDETHLVHGVPFYLAGPVINFWGRQTSFRHWQIRDGRMTHRTIYLET